jgi:hypothetical protein
VSAVVLRGCCLAATEKGQQRTWDHIPKRNCMWETTTTKNCIFVEMRNTCQVTNQSSHGELSFHHNPHLRLCWGLGLSTSRVVRRGGSRLKNAAHPTYCHCCEFCALKQKPGVLLEKKKPAFGILSLAREGGSSRNGIFLKNKSQLQTVLITASGPQA